MTNPPPVWNGKGEDPWLPQRVSALLNAAKAERSIYESVWDKLSSWLVTTTRKILGGPVIQPEMAFAQAPAWSHAVDEIIVQSIMPVMGWAYQGLFGPHYHWQDRPNVLAYLSQVKNRMSHTPDEVFNLVAGQIASGVTLGEGIPELTERVDDVLSVTETARWPNRAVVIARTETLGALNGSRNDAFQAYDEEGDEELERMWLSTRDERTRPSHVLADLQRTSMTDPFIVGGASLMFPGDPAGPAQEVIQCRCTTLLLEKGENVNLADRQLTRRR